MATGFNLDNYRVSAIPSTAYYVSEFITEEEEKFLLSKIYSSPIPKWTQLSHRRLQNWGGVPHTKGMIAEKIPDWLNIYLERIHELNVMDSKKPNHVLVNEYLSGQGIMAHLDGSLFFPTITTISLGSHIVLKLHEPSAENDDKALKLKGSLLLEPRSLLILQDKMFHDYLHSIEETNVDYIDEAVKNLPLCSDKYKTGMEVKRDTRVSMTIRHVPKTTNFKLNIGFQR